MASSKSTQAAPAALVNGSLKVVISVDPAIESVLAEIANAAFSANERVRLTMPDDERAQLDIEDLRQVIQRMGWMADLALKRMGSGDCVHDGDAATWLLSPVCSRSLAGLAPAARDRTPTP